MNPPRTHGIRFDGTALYVTHRRIEYGPFDYEWAPDLRSVDLTYRGARYGEVWSAAQMAVDLREHRLPRRVMHVAMLVTGCVLRTLEQGQGQRERDTLITAVLRAFRCERFLPENSEPSQTR